VLGSNPRLQEFVDEFGKKDWSLIKLVHPTTLLSVALVAIGLGSTWSCQTGYRKADLDSINELWIAGGKAFRIRVTAYAETGASFVAGAYYVFECAKDSERVWHPIMTFRHDDPIPIPREQMRFVNDQVGYVFMGWMYAVTTDAGSTWSVWSADKNLPNWQCCNYGLIRDVKLGDNGDGVMQLNPIKGRQGEVPELHTMDYGKHWESSATR
jgi:hypothetical protein